MTIPSHTLAHLPFTHTCTPSLHTHLHTFPSHTLAHLPFTHTCTPSLHTHLQTFPSHTLAHLPFTHTCTPSLHTHLHTFPSHTCTFPSHTRAHIQCVLTYVILCVLLLDVIMLPGGGRSVLYVCHLWGRSDEGVWQSELLSRVNVCIH